jgi:hypothetical protein
MTTLIFWLEDIRLRDDERRNLFQLSNNLSRRPFEQERDKAPDPRAQEAAHHKLSRGDL